MTASSNSCPSPAEPASRASADLPADPVAVIACGALAGAVRSIAARRGWPIELHPLSALLHDRPERIAPAVAALARGLQAERRRVAVAYADCGTYGALDEVCAELGIARLPGLHCYDLLAGSEHVARLMEGEPGTYLLTDFLAGSFSRTVAAELGLDRHPELVADYFAHYRRVVWLTEAPTPRLEAEAERIAELLGLPLTTVPVGRGRLERALQALVAAGAGPQGDAVLG